MAKLDLSALDNEYSDTSNDIFRRLSIDDIIEDPDQPRTEFDLTSLEALGKDIEKNGQIAPIRVREADENGKYKIIVGARRFRACKLRGIREMDALVKNDERLDEYSQVSENTQREGLTPLEMANFIAKRQAAGEKNAEIARKLSMDKSAITQYSALIDPPPFFIELYNQGKCTNPLYFYELKKIWNTWPDEVELWATKTDDITRSSIKALYVRLKGPDPEQPIVTVTEQTGLSGKSGLDTVNTGDSTRNAAVSDSSDAVVIEQQQDSPTESTEPKTEITTGDTETIETPKVTVVPAHNPEIEKEDSESASDPNKIKKPLLLVEYEGRAAMLLLNRRPSTAGFVFIRYEDGSGEDEVNAGDVKINLLTEASK